MEIYISERHAQSIIDISQSFGVDAKIIGRVENHSTKQVNIIGENGHYTYY